MACEASVRPSQISSRAASADDTFDVLVPAFVMAKRVEETGALERGTDSRLQLEGCVRTAAHMREEIPPNALSTRRFRSGRSRKDWQEESDSGLLERGNPTPDERRESIRLMLARAMGSRE